MELSSQLYALASLAGWMVPMSGLETSEKWKISYSFRNLTAISCVFSPWPPSIPSSQHYSPRWALASSTTSLHCSLSFVFSVHCFIFITLKSATTSLSNPIYKLLSSTFVSHPSKADCWVSEHIVFMLWGCQPHAQPPTWRTRVSVFIWVIALDLSGTGGPTSSVC
jgi:hypothetical protein